MSEIITNELKRNAGNSAEEFEHFMAGKKLNLGCGTQPIDGYVNLDIKNNEAAFPLPDIADGSIEEIRASHLLEHYPRGKVKDVLREWIRILKPGGTLKLAVPDFEIIAREYLADKGDDWAGHLMGGQVDGADFHRSCFDRRSLTEIMQSVGLEDVRDWQSELNDCASLPVSLNLMGTKKNKSAPFMKKFVPLPEKIEKKLTLPKIIAIQSMPRFCPTDNLFTALNVLMPMNIRMQKVHGVFWGQKLEAGIIRLLQDKPEFILTMDYDGWFMREHVVALYLLLRDNPQFDAVFPMQVKRDDDSILANLPMGIEKDGALDIPVDALMKQLIVPANTGHFGLTLIRASALTKMKRPMFLEVPGKNGSWDQKAGKIDPDIYFWNNFKESGCKAAMSTHIRLGHLQWVVIWPGTEESQWKPFMTYLQDLEAGKIPDGCIPDLEKHGL